MLLLRRGRVPAAALVLVAAVLLAVLHPWSRAGDATRTAAAVTCAAAPAPAEEPDAVGHEDARSGDGGTRSLYTGPGDAAGQKGADTGGPCGHRHPESFSDLAIANSGRLSRAVAPGTRLRPGAYRASIAERAALSSAASRAAVNGTSGEWSPYGNAPVETGRTEYDTTRGSTQEGLGNVAGRITAFARNAASGALYATSANGGIFRSDNAAASWSSISDTLPTQVLAGIAWSPAGGGTLIALTGDNAFGGSSLGGLGVYRSTDEGRSWTHSAGVPDGLLGFKVAVDPTNAQKVYVATGGGLFASTDAGASFTNVALPTGKNAPTGTPDCSGRPATAKDCFLANMVTDIVVQGTATPKTTGAKPGAVVAAVGWRAGTKKNADGSLQSPGNGVYRSDTGAPGSFTNLDMPSHTTTTEGLSQAQIGRLQLGAVTGEAQNRAVLYGIVSDAVKFNGGAAGIDVNDGAGQKLPNSDVLNGVYVSTDFGSSWKLLEGASQIDSDGTSNSALAPPTCKAPVIGYCPGVQGWYNLWVEPDPTQQDANGVPSRLAFGLEEVWMNDQSTPTPLDGSAPQKFNVIGRYFAGSTCTLLSATNRLPYCPVAEGGSVPQTTTHPDQHAGLFVPDGKGGVTLYAGNDGGVYKQSVDGGQAFSNTRWDKGANVGMHTTLPYDVAMAKDGTTYAGLQDNGEMKIDPDGRAYTVYGGDGFFSAVDPDKPDVAYEEYTGGGVSVTKDGGKKWKSMDPNLTSPQFSTPFEMDPANADHLIIGGRDIKETTIGPNTTEPLQPGVDDSSTDWQKIYDLGTQKHPGDASATGAKADPNNQLSAVDTRSFGQDDPTTPGPKTADTTYSGGGSTVPDPTGAGVSPASHDDHTIKIGPNDGNASVEVKVTWADPGNDWDLTLYRKAADGSLTEVGSSATSDPSEDVTLATPPAGTYVVRVTNYIADGTFDAKVTFTQLVKRGGPVTTASYVGYCGYCDTITQGTPFGNGIATNVKNGQGGTAGKSDGWHIAAAKGLPSRLITSVRMDPENPATVYVTLAGYGRRWAYPGAVGEDTSKVGTGHVFKSADGAETFTDVTGNLPDTPANWSVVHKGQLVVGTDIGVFVGNDTSGCNYAAMNGNLPSAPIASLRLKPGDTDLLAAATYGRGIYTYRFGPDAGASACPKADLANASKGTSGCPGDDGFRSVRVRPKGRGLRFDVVRKIKQPFTVDVFQQAQGRRVLDQRLVARFTGRRGSFTWKGGKARSGRRLSTGYYFVRLTIKGPGVRDIRRFALSGSSKGFKVRKDFYARTSCRLLRSAKLSGPTWGGSRKRPLGVAFQLQSRGTASVTIRKGTKVLRTVKYKRADGRTRRVTLGVKGRRAGDYTVTIAAASGTTQEKVTLISRKLR